MHSVELTVRGEDAWTVPRAIQDEHGDGRFDYDGDGFAVVVTESFYYRINSSLQTTAIFDLVEETTCRVTLLAGGAAAGLSKSTMDADGAATRKLVRKIESYSRDHDLDLERDD